MSSTDLNAMRERVPYLGWWLEGQAGRPRGPVTFVWYATEHQGTGLFQVTADASKLPVARAQQWAEAKRIGLAAARGKVFLNTWQQTPNHLLAVLIEEKPIATREIRTAILQGLYRLYEAGFEEGDFKVDIDGIAVELGTSVRLVSRAIKFLYDSGLVEDYGTFGRNWSTGDIGLSAEGVKYMESAPVRARSALANEKTVDSGSADTTGSWDVFICHASEDKDDIARPLANALSKRGLPVWYDEFSLRLGDSLRRSIDHGIARSRYGIVILSPAFFAKEWPQRELDGLVTREIQEGKMILPVWHHVSSSEIARFSPSLADKVGISTSRGLDAVVTEVLRVLRRNQG
jgi:hypothetical protein